MRVVSLLLLLGVSLPAQERPTAPAEPMIARVLSADSGVAATMSISMRGRLFHSLGVDTTGGRAGSLSVSGSDGNATGVVRVTLSPDEGALTFSVPVSGPPLEISVYPAGGASVPRLWARGHEVRVARDRDGRLYVQSGILLRFGM